MNFINRKVLGAGNATEESSLIIFDIAGISSDIQQNLFAQLPGWPATGVRLPWECYTPKRWDVFKWGTCKQYADLFDTAMRKPGAPSSEISWWLENILRHPVSYTKHRILYTVELFRNERSILSSGPPYAVNSPKYIDEIRGGMTHGVDITDKIRMWEPTIAFVPFNWFAARIFSRPCSFLWGLFFCAGTLLWSWHHRRTDQKFDFVVVVSSAIGLGNVAMMIIFGVADEGRYLMPTLVCGIVSLLRTARAEVEAYRVKHNRVLPPADNLVQ